MRQHSQSFSLSTSLLNTSWRCFYLNADHCVCLNYKVSQMEYSCSTKLRQDNIGQGRAINITLTITCLYFHIRFPFFSSPFYFKHELHSSIHPLQSQPLSSSVNVNLQGTSPPACSHLHLHHDEYTFCRCLCGRHFRL